MTGDFNGDGRIDLAAYHFINIPHPPQPGIRFGNVAIFVGLGDGNFRAATLTVDLNGTPQTSTNRIDVLADRMNQAVSLVAADFNGDGLTDLAVNQEVFLAGAGLQFKLQAALLPSRPTAVGDFNNDGIPNLILATAPVLLGHRDAGTGKGDGTFTPFETLVGTTNADNPRIGDFDGDGDGIGDVAVLNSGVVSIFLGDGANGIGGCTFTAAAANVQPPPLVVTATHTFTYSFSGTLDTGDFNRDGRADLALAVTVVSHRIADGAVTTGDIRSNAVAIYLGQSNGGFALVPQLPALPDSPNSLVVADFDGDGRADVGTVASQAFASGQISVLLGRGDGTLFNPRQRAEPTTQATPLVADLNRDGTPDVVLLDQDGTILYRQGRPGKPGVFDAPIIVNAGTPARDVALLTDTVGGQTNVRLAALDFDNDRVSIYARNASGQFVRSAGPATGLLPTRLASADLNGDGRGDLVVVNTGSGNLSVFRGTAGGFAVQNLALSGGNGPFEITLANVDNALGVDIVAANAASGDVSVFYNQGAAVFGPEKRFRADAGPFDVAAFDGISSVRSRAKTAAVAVGRFTGDLLPDVLAVNSDSNTFSLLSGRAGGTLSDPRTFQAGSSPTQVVPGDFNGDGKLDAVILNTGDNTISIFLGDGQGNFFEHFVASAGNEATGFTARDVTGDDILDFLVGNVFGDVLIVVGKGDGTFNPFTRVEQNVPLVTTDLDGDGLADVIVASQSLDVALSQQRLLGSSIIDNPTANFDQSSADGLIGPGNLALFDMNGDGWDDIVIANSGSNDVRVHLATAANQWDPVARTFFAGTNPTGITAAQLNGDGVLDLIVANKGSNDVSILFGQGSGAGWTLTSGPRLDVGAGPIGVEVRNVVGDATPDLLVSNSLDGTLSILTGIGAGFFNDATPTVVNIGGSLLQGLTGDFLLNQAGTIFRFNPGTLTVTPVFASANGVTSFTSSGGSLFVGRSDGDVTLLTDANGDGQFTASLNFSDAQLTNPSALEVVGSEVYVTSSGQTRVFVFGLSDGVPVPAFNSDPDLRGQLADVSPFSQAGLALIATLLTGSEGEGVADAGDPSFVFGLGVGDGDVALAMLTNLLVGANGGDAESDGSGEVKDAAGIGHSGVAGKVDVEFSFNDFIIGLEEALEQLRSELHGPKSAGTTDGLFEAIDLTFRGLARTANGLDSLLQEMRPEGAKVLEATGSVLKSGLQVLGAAGMEATGSELAGLLSSVWQTLTAAGRSLKMPLLESLRWANLFGIPVASADGSDYGPDPLPVYSTADLLAPDDISCRQLAMMAALTFGMWPTPGARTAEQRGRAKR